MKNKLLNNVKKICLYKEESKSYPNFSSDMILIAISYH